MTIQEMNETEYFAGMMCMYKGNKHDILGVDFEENLFGLTYPKDSGAEPGEVMWVRCENIELVEP